MTWNYSNVHYAAGKIIGELPFWVAVDPPIERSISFWEDEFANSKWNQRIADVPTSFPPNTQRSNLFLINVTWNVDGICVLRNHGSCDDIRMDELLFSA